MKNARTTELSLENILRSTIEAFDSAWEARKDAPSNQARSSYFVSELAKAFLAEDAFQGIEGVNKRVQIADKAGKKQPGEWLLDAAIVQEREVERRYRIKSATIVEKILLAVESEFSTNINAFCFDFSKLLHIKSENYLYIAGLDQIDGDARQGYRESQIEFSRELVRNVACTAPFFLVFVPTPGKGRRETSLWDRLPKDELLHWIHGAHLNAEP